jgi:hypothetical protein
MWYSSLFSPEFWKLQEASIVDFLHCQQMAVTGGVAERKQIPPKNSGESQLIVHIFCGIKIYWQCCTNPAWLHMTIHNHGLLSGAMQEYHTTHS